MGEMKSSVMKVPRVENLFDLCKTDSCELTWIIGKYNG